MSRPGEGFPKRIRLRKRREFLAVQRGGQRVSTPHFIVYGRPNGGGATRLGITVSRKAGNAVTRNRVKRLVREAFRRNTARLPTGLDLVLVARQGQPPAGYEEVLSEMLGAAGRLQALPQSRPAQRRRDGRRR